MSTATVFAAGEEEGVSFGSSVPLPATGAGSGGGSAGCGSSASLCLPECGMSGVIFRRVSGLHFFSAKKPATSTSSRIRSFFIVKVLESIPDKARLESAKALPHELGAAVRCLQA